MDLLCDQLTLRVGSIKGLPKYLGGCFEHGAGRLVDVPRIPARNRKTR
jgi:hypothetical protein